MTIIALILVTIGALNWLSVGIFNFNVINWMFTPSAYVGARIIYALVGIAGVWLIAYLIYNKFSPKRIHAVEEMASDKHHSDTM
ncbi:MAG: DUF378 domain-containing protein [Clostridiales bacterium]|nr:DUF378 domain-containing protein [Clostridiales bacterium]MBD5100636.1 DUF378 domain-containing protein [Clostridiales bacterium]